LPCQLYITTFSNSICLLSLCNCHRKLGQFGFNKYIIIQKCLYRIVYSAFMLEKKLRETPLLISKILMPKELY
jgi:hypothetical protein